MIHRADLRNWTEDFNDENGNYQNTCSVCHRDFIGHKMRRGCKLCFNSHSDKAPTQTKLHTKEELQEAFEDLRKVDFESFKYPTFQEWHEKRFPHKK